MRTLGVMANETPPLPGEPDPSVFLTPELRRRLDHDRTVAALTALGYAIPTLAELAEAEQLRVDTIRRQAEGRTLHRRSRVRRNRRI